MRRRRRRRRRKISNRLGGISSGLVYPFRCEPTHPSSRADLFALLKVAAAEEKAKKQFRAKFFSKAFCGERVSQSLLIFVGQAVPTAGCLVGGVSREPRVARISGICVTSLST